MSKSLAYAALALVLLGTLESANAETCGALSADKGAPATVGKDGVGATGWTGGTGGLTAGVDNEKQGQKPEASNPNVAKGLDPTKGVTGNTGGPTNNKGPTSGPKPNC